MEPSKPNIALFVTCPVDLMRPEVGFASVKLLEQAGCKVTVPPQGCCGQIAYNNGLPEEARELAWQVVQTFQDFDYVVLPSGSCGGMMRKHYPDLFKGTEDEVRAADVAGRIWELTDFLLNVCHIKLKDVGEPTTVAMHTSCSARREMGVAEVGPKLLGQLENVNLVEQVRAEECCGFGGTFAIRHPEISGAMVSEKVDALVDTGAREFVTTDCGCLMNIHGYAEKNRKAMTGQHILSFLWDRTGGDKGEQS